MDLVVDANVLFSAAITDGATAALLLRDELSLFAPAYLFEEFESYRETLLERTHREPSAFVRYVTVLRRHIAIVPRERFAAFEPAAAVACPDRADVPYFALALAIDADLWSDDAALRRQATVNVVTTNDLLEQLDR